MATTLLQSDLPGLTLRHRGKVRDVFELPADSAGPASQAAGPLLLIVASDRLSAFDVVLPDPIPGKGEMLCQISNFWFGRTAHIVPNHLTGIDVASVLPAGVDAGLYAQRAVVTRKLKPVPIEAIARGYLIGSGWKDYQRTGRVSGIALPDGLQMAQVLPQPIFTPSTKAAVGDHDENVAFDDVVRRIGVDLAEQVRAATLTIYRHAAEYALGRGIIIADTKLEFGLDDAGELVLGDEVCTPDSSRFWPADQYEVGRGQPSFDKQYVRDWASGTGWDKSPPAPPIPDDVVAATRERYVTAYEKLAGEPFSAWLERVA